ncbi:hypothetical protein MVEN_00338300 [Mycena venus]|uniref:F-box domain-containing protein n=1 Tax=Mycena venus TaxID=2733690 RepID=A0A8H6YTP8_9AGAR|nr:hypothetical protein MVEN_00338300 [Mycena venus]
MRRIFRRTLLLLGDAPLLRFAELNPLWHFKFGRPLEQLATLHVRQFFHVAEMVSFLRYCPNLFSLSCGPHILRMSENLPPPLELLSLRSLKIANEQMLPCLTVPRLEQLQISRFITMESATAGMQSLMSRSSCVLQFLSIRVDHATTAQLQDFLHTASSVVRLKLLFGHRPGFESQLQVLRGPDVLPRLQHLEIHDHGVSLYRDLLDMLWTRQLQGPLQSVRIFLSMISLGPSPARIPPDDVMTEFHTLARTGLQLQLITRERGESEFIDHTLLDTFGA